MREVQPKMLRFSEAAKLKLQSEVFFYSPSRKIVLLYA